MVQESAFWGSKLKLSVTIDCLLSKTTLAVGRKFYSGCGVFLKICFDFIKIRVLIIFVRFLLFIVLYLTFVIVIKLTMSIWSFYLQH